MQDSELKAIAEERRAGNQPGGNGRPAPPVGPAKPRPAASTNYGKLALGAIALVVLIAALFAAGYLPRLERARALDQSVAEKKTSLPQVSVVRVKASPAHSDLLLPGNITPLTEAVINARADGYLKRRYVDFGDKVKQGQLLAEIEAPELDQQVQQARANLSQVQAALSRAQHELTQATANVHLADVTVQRWKTLSDRGVVSKQEYDQRQADYDAKQAALESAQANVRAAEDNIRASQANLDRLMNLQEYEKVVAPFTGIVTARNVDIGALISSNGNTPMFRMAQIDMLRIMVDVPQQSAPEIKVGEPAEVTLLEFPGRKFMGRVSRTANALDANTRTLPTEVQVENRDGKLLPNMFAQVNLIGAQALSSLLVPGEALIVRANGTQVAVIQDGNRVHLQPVDVGRDNGTEIEIRSGLSGNETVVANPTDDVREGAEVDPVMQKESSRPPASSVQQRKAQK